MTRHRVVPAATVAQDLIASGGPLRPAIRRNAPPDLRYSSDRAVRGVGNIVAMNRRGIQPGRAAVPKAAPAPARRGEAHP